MGKTIAGVVAVAAGVVAAGAASGQSGEPAGGAAQAPAATPAAPAEPAGVPVPEGPVVNKQELEGGLIIEDIKIGEGYEIKPGNAVVAHYHGTLKADGKVFDSSFQRGEPIGFPLTGVIQGWQKGVPGMKVGGIRRLTIPAALGYGAQGAGASIPPNSDLVFVVQIVDALEVNDTKVGEGEAATGAAVAVTAYTIKDADGKEIEKADASKPYIWLPGEFMAIQYGLDGMKVGGKRTLKVPKQMNQTAPAIQSTRTPNVPLTIEVELLGVRNLPQQPGRR